MAPGIGRHGKRLDGLSQGGSFSRVEAQPSGAKTGEILPERGHRGVAGERVEGGGAVLRVLPAELAGEAEAGEHGIAGAAILLEDGLEGRLRLLALVLRGEAQGLLVAR